MAAKAILICRPNSHYFQERTLTLDQPIKVGRSVPCAKPTLTNAIFDCKVLSRHHALLLYENGKFYLQDTKSGNGTFVNNNRLSIENHEVCSGDIVQFGVDVVENNRKVTHGCIIATLRLYLPDQKEAKASSNITEGERHGNVPPDDLYKLEKILQETKERLLSIVSTLETQLQQERSTRSKDRLKEEIAKLRENFKEYQDAAKGAIEKVHAEKIQAVALAMEQERAKISAKQDVLLAKEQLEQTQLEIQEVAQKLTEIQNNAAVEQKIEHGKQVRELEQNMKEEETKIIELEANNYELTLKISKEHTFEIEESQNGPQSTKSPELDDSLDNYHSDQVDSKTLELKRRIEILEKISDTNKAKTVELDKALIEKKKIREHMFLFHIALLVLIGQYLLIMAWVA